MLKTREGREILTERSRWDVAWLMLCECFNRSVAIRSRVLISTMGKKVIWLWHNASRHLTAFPVSPFCSCMSASPHNPSATASISSPLSHSLIPPPRPLTSWICELQTNFKIHFYVVTGELVDGAEGWPRQRRLLLRRFPAPLRPWKPHKILNWRFPQGSESD